MKVALKICKTKTQRVRIEIYSEDGKLRNVVTSSLEELETTGREFNMPLEYYNISKKEIKEITEYAKRQMS